MADIAEEDIDTLGIKALKELIASAGLSTEDCIDKSDLRARAREALQKRKAAAAARPAPSAQPAERQMGGYSCIVQGPADLLAGEAGAAPADMLIVVLHGLGATNSDLVDVPRALINMDANLGSKRIVSVFPQAPSSALGNAWWSFDVMSFISVQMMPAGPEKEAGMAKLIRNKPDGLDACRAQMAKLHTEARALAGGAAGPLAAGKVVLAGFSLGAITSLDIALQMGEAERPAGVVFMNGAPIVVDEWAERLRVHPGLPVHLTSGLQDATLPNYASEWVRQLLEANGAKVSHKYHNGGHEVGPPDVLKGIAQFVASRL